MKKMIKLSLNAFYAFIIAIFAAILVVFILGWNPYIVKSGSMEPSIKTGSVAIVNDKYAYDKIDVGDVIAYKAMDNTLVTHRVIDMQEGVLETKGDNNDVSDGFVVNQENYQGLTVVSIPYIGYLFAWIQTKRGLILSITFVCAALVLEYAMSDSTKDCSEDKETN